MRAAVEGTLRRLYRQRNIVLHGDSTQAVALDATLRTCGPRTRPHCARLPTLNRALIELLADGTGIQVSRDDDGRRYYINGRHRTTAMLEAGVRRTVIIRWNMPDSAKDAE